MSKYVYNIKDTINNEWLDFCAVANNNGSYVRKVMNLAIRLLPLRDMEVYKIGEYDDEKYIIPIKPELVAWDCYKFPETKSENLASVGLSSAEVRNNFNEHFDKDNEEMEV